MAAAAAAASAAAALSIGIRDHAGHVGARIAVHEPQVRRAHVVAAGLEPLRTGGTHKGGGGTLDAQEELPLIGLWQLPCPAR